MIEVVLIRNDIYINNMMVISGGLHVSKHIICMMLSKCEKVYMTNFDGWIKISNYDYFCERVY